VPPIKLTDDELSAVMRAARPIAVDRRDEFLQRVASNLQDCVEIGPGSVHRAIAEAQKKLMDYPQIGSGSWSKYGG